jgi:hypothetical protein
MRNTPTDRQICLLLTHTCWLSWRHLANNCKPFASNNHPSLRARVRTNSSRLRIPYRLAPDLELSSLDLLPLPARSYSPSIAGTCSSAMTPEFSTNGTTNFNVASSSASETSSDADRYRNSVKTMDSVDMELITAWGRLGGQ